MAITEENKLMSPEKYNKGVAKWAQKVRNASVNILQRTHGRGALSKGLRRRLLDDREGGPAYVGVGFRFYRYGAYREYGAGRGYIVKDGIIVRGHSAWSDKKNRQELLDARVSKYHIQRMRTEEPYGKYAIIKRSPLHWLDPPIDQNIQELAELSGEYYGDYALKKVLEKLPRLKIKHYGKK